MQPAACPALLTGGDYCTFGVLLCPSWYEEFIAAMNPTRQGLPLPVSPLTEVDGPRLARRVFKFIVALYVRCVALNSSPSGASGLLLQKQKRGSSFGPESNLI